MKLILCLDDHNGMAFNHRRQSMDAAVTKEIAKKTSGVDLYVTDATAKLFDGPDSEGAKPRLKISADPLGAAGNGDFAFCEFADPAAYKDKIEELIVYNWNRHYPADTKCTLELKEFRKVAERDFAGKSHEKVTELIYNRN